MDRLVNELSAIHYTAPSFVVCFALVIFNPLFWNLVGRLEHRHKLLTRMAGGNAQQAVYAIAIIIFTLGVVRDAAFAWAIQSQPTNKALFHPIYSTFVAFLLMFAGNVLVLSSMWRLGLTGTYLGDYFGILKKERIVAFPFSIDEHPMYNGATMVFAGYAFWKRSLAGLILAAVVAAVYKIASHYEGKFTEMIYIQNSVKTKSKRSIKAA